ncbi:MAG: folylpolyglutamate synthase/dihydrofolate synthase family protein [Anaerolineae bacterium]|nr:bifunctional folylpolyglutamate synthase/dihydrofolate synthase [Anaerolineae bacterium]MDW8100742.1 folylpolyglutamate synthase/dihydrofolate synthase family protein [Anaerolineae bacterium]
MLTYREALVYLDRYANYELNRPVRYTDEVFNLSRVHELLARLGHPHRAYPTVHIAGSKGKGSTAVMIESALRAAGYRTGLYTSPHLHTFRERIRVDGELISPQELVGLVEEVAPHAEAVAGITWFEVVTALAFLYFAQRAVDIAVIEVGLGGRLDATNVITPLVSVITSLSYEHTAWLGDTLSQIAFEKAGIIKPGVPVVSAPQDPEAMAVIERVSAERMAPLIRVGEDWRFRLGPIRPDGQSFEVLLPVQMEDKSSCGVWLFDLPLLGRHQVVNAMCALAAMAQLPSARFHVSLMALRQGLAQARWPGRAEILSLSPLVIVDGAHNGDSARRLAETLSEWFPGQRWTFVVGTLSDKDHAAILRGLAPMAAELIMTRSRSIRATDPELLAQIARQTGVPTRVVPNVPVALAEALALGDPVCLTGSLSIVAEAREAWAEAQGGAWPEEEALTWASISQLP